MQPKAATPLQQEATRSLHSTTPGMPSESLHWSSICLTHDSNISLFGKHIDALKSCSPWQQLHQQYEARVPDSHWPTKTQGTRRIPLAPKAKCIARMAVQCRAMSAGLLVVSYQVYQQSLTILWPVRDGGFAYAISQNSLSSCKHMHHSVNSVQHQQKQRRLQTQHSVVMQCWICR